VAADEAPAAEAPAAEAAAPAAAGLPAAYPASGTAIPDGSVLIAGELIGSENGWDGTAGSGRASAFDGNIETFFDPATASVDYCGIDAGEEMILTKIIIHPRTTFLDRFNGATIEASNDPEFEESVELFFSVEQAAEIAFVDCTSEMEESENTGYRYFRYINYMSHGDVAEVELYGKAKDGTNPTYGAADAPAASAPAAAAPAGGAEPTILWDFNSDEALNDVMSGANAVSYFGDTIDGVECYEFLASGNDPYVSINIPADNVEDVVWAKARVKNPSYSTAIELFGATNGRSLAGSECTHIELKSEDDGWYTYIIYIPEENVKTVNAYKDPQYAITEPYWAGTVEFIRLDPLWREGDDGSDAGGNMEGGESVYIDYIAFFPTKEDALAFRPELDNYAFPEQGPAAVEAPVAEETSAAEAAPAAAEFVTYTEYPEMTGTELVYATGDMDMLSGYDAKGGIGVDLFNLASGGTSYCLKRDTSAWYDFEVAEKTDVTFYVGYIARDGSNRGLDYAVDGGARIFMDLAESAEQQWVSATFTVDAGKHSFYLYAPTGMDDSTLKSCDIYTIELYGTPAAVEEPAPAPVVEEAPAVEEVPAEEPAAEEAPAEEVPVEEPAEEIVEEVVEEAPAAAAVVEEAPQTFDFGVIAAISALVSLAGFSLTKKR
ncbi:MAG: hypothetical protein II333_01535, partial [Clostridia bacterium]|nr:hypothetical protein [Clostridia bacterium]